MVSFKGTWNKAFCCSFEFSCSQFVINFRRCCAYCSLPSVLLLCSLKEVISTSPVPVCLEIWQSLYTKICESMDSATVTQCLVLCDILSSIMRHMKVYDSTVPLNSKRKVFVMPGIFCLHPLQVYSHTIFGILQVFLVIQHTLELFMLFLIIYHFLIYFYLDFVRFTVFYWVHMIPS